MLPVRLRVSEACQMTETGLRIEELAELAIECCHDMRAAVRIDDLATLNNKISDLEVIVAMLRHERNLKARVELAREAPSQ